MHNRDLRAAIANTEHTVDDINAFMKDLNGTLRNHKGFWNKVIHSKQPLDWAEHVVYAEYLYNNHVEVYTRELAESIAVVKQRLLDDEPVVKKHHKEYNRHPFRALMEIKDAVNKIKNKSNPPPKAQPTEGLPPPVEKTKRKAKPKKTVLFHNLFDLE